MNPSYLIPNWPAPKNIKAYFTTRIGGVSSAPYASFNLGDHVNDASENIEANRNKLSADLDLPNHPKWLQQVHGNDIINATDWRSNIIADGIYSKEPNQICTVMTADCLPILLCNTTGTQVMALHGGWRSLALGIVPKGVALFCDLPESILVWLGPAIGPKVYEVGHEVREQFLALDSRLSQAFVPSPAGRWLLDVYAVARFQCQQLGVTHIYGGNHCTYSEADKFFSYRRDGLTGRMAAGIYF